MPKTSKARLRRRRVICQLRDAALELKVSFPTIKQWIYKRKYGASRRQGTTAFRRARWTACCFGPGERQGLTEAWLSVA
jgi:hypothetical protein